MQLTRSATTREAASQNEPAPVRAGWSDRFWPWWRELVGWLGPDVLVPFVVTRLALLIVAEVASLTIPYTLGSVPATPPQVVAWYAPLLQMDTGWYMTIAADWYRYDPGLGIRTQQSVAFFPFYPALVRVFNAIAGGADVQSFMTSGLIVANASAVAGLAVLNRLVRREFNAAVARRTVWYVLAFPVSFALSSAYAESTFLLLSVLAVYAARSNRWPLAGVAAAAATLTRPYGVLIVIPLAVEYARTRWTTPRSLLQVGGLALGLPVVALAGWMVYMFSLGGDPLLFAHNQVAWEAQQLTSPLDTLLTGYGRFRDQQLQGRFDIGSLRFAVAGVAVVGALASWRVLPVMYAVFATAFCLVILSSGSLVSIWRHVLVIFPLFVVAARAGTYTTFDRLYVSLALVGSGLMITLLVTNWAMIS
jgi:hypothetical protein